MQKRFFDFTSRDLELDDLMEALEKNTALLTSIIMSGSKEVH